MLWYRYILPVVPPLYVHIHLPWRIIARNWPQQNTARKDLTRIQHKNIGWPAQTILGILEEVLHDFCSAFDGRLHHCKIMPRQMGWVFVTEPIKWISHGLTYTRHNHETKKTCTVPFCLEFWDIVGIELVCAVEVPKGTLKRRLLLFSYLYMPKICSQELREFESYRRLKTVKLEASNIKDVYVWPDRTSLKQD